MIQNLKFTRLATCQKHRLPLVSICVAPECFNYRQLCQQCLIDDVHHAKMHLARDQAYKKTQTTLDNLFKGLKALRKKIIHTMDTKVNNNTGLNEIQLKLQQIKKLLNSKIESFHVKIRKIYEKNIKHKLNELFFIVEKSYQFLEEEKLKLIKTQKLKPFYITDLQHDLKYYESYLQQILQRYMKKFKTGFDHDKVLKLVSSFEQNLSQIFKFNEPILLQPQPHLIYSNPRSTYILQLKQNHFIKQQIGFVSQEYNWLGFINSIYYSLKDCYYVFGDGRHQSNKIRRLQFNNKQIKQLQVKMEAKRINFAVCLFNDEIYIVGGENEKQGCLTKCQKFIPSEGKIYIINSLQQKSAQHTLCPYKNKFILKFGGTDIMDSVLEMNPQRYRVLAPQIYSFETQQWSILQINTIRPYSGIDFGLRPGIFCSSYKEVNEKIIIIEGQMMHQRVCKMRYDIRSSENLSNYLKQMIITPSKLQISSRSLIFSDCSFYDNEGRIYFGVMDENRNGNFYISNILV